MKTKNKLIVGSIILVLLCLSFFVGENHNKESLVDGQNEVGIHLEDRKADEKTHLDNSQPLETVDHKETMTDTSQLTEEVVNDQLAEEADKNKNNISEEKRNSNKAEPKVEEANQSVKENQLEVAKKSETDVVKEKEKLQCTLSISCATILEHMEDLTEGKAELVPADGMILKPETLTFEEGDTVFDVLQKAVKTHKRHMEFVNTPVYKSVYIEGINNLYEFDCGELSGWTYRVNGEFPSYGCNLYTLEAGDQIEWLYTCDLGRDVGGYIEGVE